MTASHGAARPGSAATRERILDAAAEVMRELGLARATTKEIARAAGYSEATLYKHFADKTELFVRVLAERAPDFVGILARLPGLVGTGALAEHLRDTARQAVLFYAQGVPMAASVFAEPTVLARHRERIGAMAAGPGQARAALAEYLRAEQRAGRVRADADPEAAAALLLGACFQEGFLRAFAGVDPTEGLDEFSAKVVADLLTGIGPDRETSAS
ncbi:TetR/AcrR family transcriptional regulator [Allonocardiopsis opalescens]|uniref:TetR family transcriptional regulator n=1 Tax=Allonocardiopsis opalescens TaxID=1144618 RepID=A0A2T0PUA9_9ACTN|nr:TetR/AcrR family transcriptional regulator [Allonocardiopsis opalescens]PRX92487.1 TetR family transcriptional regulator [Allonocardiopsis opalescens]